MTIDIMLLVVLSTVFSGFQPLTAVMIVVISLLDDIPIMTIAYDNTPVSPKLVRWRMPRILSISVVLGLAGVVQSFGLLMLGMELASRPDLSWIGNFDQSHLQTMMFLQLVAGGHLLLFVTRAEGAFFRKLYPAPLLFWAIMATQVLAILMCCFSWLVPAIEWKIIALVSAYNLAWMVLLSAARVWTERLIDHRIRGRQRGHRLMNLDMARLFIKGMPSEPDASLGDRDG